MAKCQLRAPASHPPKVSQAGMGVLSQGQQQKLSPRRAKRGYALKMRRPEPTITRIAATATQCVTRTTGWCRFCSMRSLRLRVRRNETLRVRACPRLRRGRASAP